MASAASRRRLLGILHEAQVTGEWTRMKACRQCEYAFFDRSKNRSATWCAMSICGNRTKNRAYYRRRASEHVSAMRRRPAPRSASAARGAGIAAILPLFVSAGGIVLHNMVLAAAYVMMALGLNIVVGFAGLLDLGYVAFFAIGAHAAAHFGSAFWGIHLNFLFILVIAVAWRRSRAC